MKSIRIGSGAGYAGDRLEPALELIEKGRLDYIGFECLAERTIALAQQEKLKNSEKGYNSLFEYRMEAVVPLAWKHKVKVITNMGAANPLAAAEVAADIARKNGISGIKIAAVTGDDVLDKLGGYKDTIIWENKKPLSEFDGEIISANVYMGAEGIVRALRDGADIVITGRVADPSLFLAPLIYEFGWSWEDWKLLGTGTLIGHLLECGGQVCGGYYAEPGKKEVPMPENIGFPLAEVKENGDFFITKAEGTGGIINRHTCAEQMIYEIHNPETYYTPDVVADFSKVVFEEIGENKVAVKNVSGHPKTETLKVSIGYKDCFIGEGQISYGGTGCLRRARLAADILKKRLEMRKLCLDEVKFDIIGLNALYWNKEKIDTEPEEVRVRLAARTKDKMTAFRIGEEVEALYTNGPAGGCGAVKSVSDIVSVASMLINRKDVMPMVSIKEVK